MCRPTQEGETETLKYVQKSQWIEFKTPVIWKNVLIMLSLHVAAFYGLHLMLTVGTWKTVIWTLLLVVLGNVGITAGAHRLWSHKCYKANDSLKVVLMLLQSMTFQKSVYDWVRDHRLHHKYTHTDADPHNPERGYFYAHIGWLMMKKHEEVLAKGRGLDFSDVENDSVVKFQRKYYPELVGLMGFILPALVPIYCWGEDPWVSWYAPTFFRFICTLNITLLVNSLAHAWGTRPYDKTFAPADNALVSFLATGEGWHNYHHVFPWDYKTGEFSSYRSNLTTLIIDFCSAMGWAYDLKSVSVDMINNRKKRTGDGETNYSFGSKHGPASDEYWGWDDSDLKLQEGSEINISNKLVE